MKMMKITMVLRMRMKTRMRMGRMKRILMMMKKNIFDR
jgi:hypothetical protein